jgi:hypothetical protein
MCAVGTTEMPCVQPVYFGKRIPKRHLPAKPCCLSCLPGESCPCGLSTWRDAPDDAKCVQAVALPDYCPVLNKALLQNLTHQQQKVRVAALQAVGAIVPVNPTILKETLPAVAKLNLDRSHQIREQVRVSLKHTYRKTHTHTRRVVSCLFVSVSQTVLNTRLTCET